MMTTPIQEQYLLYCVIILISAIFITWLSIPSKIEISQNKIQQASISKNDLYFIACNIRFFIALMASLILIIPGNIRFHKLQDVVGFYELPYLPCVVLSMLLLMFLIKTFRLIDGIDSLAATTGIMLNSIVSAVLIELDQYKLAAISLILVGSVSGLIKRKLGQPKYVWVFA